MWGSLLFDMTLSYVTCINTYYIYMYNPRVISHWLPKNPYLCLTQRSTLTEIQQVQGAVRWKFNNVLPKSCRMDRVGFTLLILHYIRICDMLSKRRAILKKDVHLQFKTIWMPVEVNFLIKIFLNPSDRFSLCVLKWVNFRYVLPIVFILFYYYFAHNP